MAESARQSATQGELGDSGEGGENSADGDGLGGGDHISGAKVNDGDGGTVRNMSWSDITAAAVEPLDVLLTTGQGDHLEAIQVLLPTGVKKKKYINAAERSRIRRRSVDSLQGGYSYNLLVNGVSDIKGKGAYGQIDSIVLEGLGSGSAVESDLACTSDMERVDSTDIFCYSSNDETLHCSPNHFSSEDEEANCDREASDHSDTDTDHSDSSDDDNPTSQVDRMIERHVRVIMDGENSNVSSDTEDTDSDFDDTESDITDVSPLVSCSTSPTLGMSPVIQRRNLPSSMFTRPPFARHYGVRGTDGDVEDELDENGMIPSFDDRFFDVHREDADLMRKRAPKMSNIIEAVIKLSVQQSQNKHDLTNVGGVESLFGTNHHLMQEDDKQRNICPNLNANPHHRHLRKTHGTSRRKNMTFTNEEEKTIKSHNNILLKKLFAVNNRKNKHHGGESAHRHTNRQPTAAINRRKQEEEIEKDNDVLARRLHDVKSSRTIASSRGSGKDSSYHSSNRHHKSHHNSSGQHSSSSHHTSSNYFDPPPQYQNHSNYFPTPTSQHQNPSNYYGNSAYYDEENPHHNPSAYYTPTNNQSTSQSCSILARQINNFSSSHSPKETAL